MIFEATWYSSVGDRQCNEDAAMIRQYHNLTAAAVADGLGGHGGGDVASQTALGYLSEHLDALQPLTREAVVDMCKQMNQSVLAKQSETQSMKTTLAMLLSDDTSTYFVHIGDSRIYHFRDEKIMYQSMDHSVSQMAVLAGEIDLSDIRFHVDRNKVLRALGSDTELLPGIAQSQNGLQNGDAILLCTDGFWEHVLEDEMLHALSRADTAKAWLAAMTAQSSGRGNGKRDNHTAIVIFVHSES